MEGFDARDILERQISETEHIIGLAEDSNNLSRTVDRSTPRILVERVIYDTTSLVLICVVFTRLVASIGYS